MRLRIRHIARDGMSLKSEDILQAKNPKAGAQMFAHRHYIRAGERIDVIMESHHDVLNYDVTKSRIDEGGVRVSYVGKNG